MEIRPLQPSDWPAVRAIYEQALTTRLATFETASPEWAAWDDAYLDDHRLVADRVGEVVGWAGVLPTSRRPCYAGVVEDSVYVAADARGQGVGRALLERLVASADAAGIWTVQASILADNVPSIELHKRCGFRLVGTRERIGQLDGVWRDTVLLERRGP